MTIRYGLRPARSAGPGCPCHDLACGRLQADQPAWHDWDQAVVPPPCRASWSSASPSLDSEVLITVPPNLLIASTALSGVTFSTIRNRQEVPGWSRPRTW